MRLRTIHAVLAAARIKQRIIAVSALLLSMTAGPACADFAYVEFRARSGPEVGHSYIVIGRSTVSGRKTAVGHFGFFPAGTDGDYRKSVFGLPGAVGRMREDMEWPTLVSFIVPLSDAQHQRLLNALRRWQKRSPTFRLFEVNCNAFVADMARAIGLNPPAEYAMIPLVYVRALRNGSANRTR